MGATVATAAIERYIVKISAVLLLTLVLIANLAFADSQREVSSGGVVDISALTPEQQQAVQAIAGQMRDKKSETPQILQTLQGIDKDQIKGWAEVGTEAGKAVSNFAKEIGAPVSEFLGSGVGKAVFVLAFLNYGGGKLLNFFMNIAWFVSLTPIFLYVMWKTFQRFVLQVVVLKEKKYNPNIFLRLFGVNEKSCKVENRPEIKDDEGNNIAPIFGWFCVAGFSFLWLWLMWPKWPG